MTSTASASASASNSVSQDRSETLTVELPRAIDELASLAPGQKILSVFLDTSAHRIEKRGLLLAFRAGCKAVRSELSGPELEAFEGAVRRIERYLARAFRPHGPGLAVFTAERDDRLIVVRLPQRPLLEHVRWRDQPDILPLQAMLDNHERVAVVLFGTEQTRLLTVFLGEIELQRTFEDYVPARQATGGWFALQQSNFARHREDHLRRHAARTAHALVDLLRAAPFDRLLVAGPEEARAVLCHHLPRPLRSRLAGTLELDVGASDAEVLAATLRAATGIERLEELRVVEELLDARSTPHTVLGPIATLDALAGGRVHVLVLTESFDESLRDHVVQQALAQNARIEVVAGSAATLLDKYGSIGGWTRYAASC